MRYNFIEIGTRIRDLRKIRNWSQEVFVDKLKEKFLPITRKTISKIEQGDENKFTLAFLLTACDVFSCDMGYLLGEYDCKTRDKQFIRDTTGLTELSIDRLTSHRGINNDFIDFLLSSDHFFKIDSAFTNLQNVIQWYNSCITGVHQCEEQAEAMDKNSLSYKQCNQQWDTWMDSAKRWSAEQDMNIYQLGILFGNMLNQYRAERVIIYGSHRED